MTTVVTMDNGDKMAYKSKNYRPNKKSRQILARAWELVTSVPYRVTSRWLFYPLLQEGYYRGKSDYKDKFLPLLSRARHNTYEDWRPDTLHDDTRIAVVKGAGCLTPDDWVSAVKRGASCELSRWVGQTHYVEVWFEANAMKGQFEHYTQNITLRPFGGMPSIDFKFEIAKDLERLGHFYGLPIKILYFGDWDEGGRIIPETSVNDIRGWCGVDFEFIRVGLNEGDGERLGIPENFEKPGAYQWEALSDRAARELIQGAIEGLVDYDKMNAIAELESRVSADFRRYLGGYSWNERP